MKSFLTFTKGERVAIIVLAAVIFFLIAAIFFISNRPSNVKKHLHNLDSIMVLHEKAVEEYYNRQQTTDNRQQTSSTKDKVTETARRQVSKSYKETINNINKKVQQPKAKSLSSTTNDQKLNLNSADSTELQSLPGIGPFFAKNIVEYRNKLGGFIDKKQLLEVYAFDSTRMANIENHIVIDSIELRKVKVNTDDFKTILRHPYIEYEDVKKIINYRESKGMIKDWETYLKVVGRDIDERLERYLEF